jgi:hypothetical protein
MAFHQTTVLQPPPTPKFIPPGQYTAIDSQYYQDNANEPVSGIFDRGKPLRAHTVTLQSPGFIQTTPSLALGPIAVNQGSYLYNQQTGLDNSHV